MPVLTKRTETGQTSRYVGQTSHVQFQKLPLEQQTKSKQDKREKSPNRRLNEELEQSDRTAQYLQEKFKRRLILEKQTMKDGIGAMETGDIREMELVKDHLSEAILKMECEINDIVSMMASQVNMPVEDVALYRAEQKLEIGELKTIFKQLESRIQDYRDNQQSRLTIQRRGNLDDQNQQTQTVPQNTPSRWNKPRRNLNDDFAKMGNMMGNNNQERDESRTEDDDGHHSFQT